MTQLHALAGRRTWSEHRNLQWQLQDKRYFQPDQRGTISYSLKSTIHETLWSFSSWLLTRRALWLCSFAFCSSTRATGHWLRVKWFSLSAWGCCAWAGTVLLFLEARSSPCDHSMFSPWSTGNIFVSHVVIADQHLFLFGFWGDYGDLLNHSNLLRHDGLPNEMMSFSYSLTEDCTAKANPRGQLEQSPGMGQPLRLRYLVEKESPCSDCCKGISRGLWRCFI